MLDRTVPRHPVRGPHTKEARNAKPTKADPLPATHPDYTHLNALYATGCTKAERIVATKRNRGSHWEKIAQDTGYALLTVKRMHRSAQNKAMRGSIPLRAKAQPGYVYFLRSDDHIKIGYATDVAARVKELQCGNPTTLTLVGAIAGKPADERALHRRFNSDRVNGEWFRRTPKLLAFIAEGRLVA